MDYQPKSYSEWVAQIRRDYEVKLSEIKHPPCKPKELTKTVTLDALEAATGWKPGGEA